MSKKQKIRAMRDTAMVSPGGKKASHKMAWVGDPSKKRGKFGVFPTIAPKEGKEKSTDPEDWKKQSLKEAKKKGEFIKVKSRRRAKRLAAGSWKQGRDKREAMKKYRDRKKEERRENK